jgi:hypothetical protein
MTASDPTPAGEYPAHGDVGDHGLLLPPQQLLTAAVQPVVPGVPACPRARAAGLALFQRACMTVLGLR